MIKTIIFDIGNVLIPWSPRRLFEKLIADPAELEYFLNEVCPLSWHAQVDGGKRMAEAVAERTALYPDYAELIASFYARIDEMFDAPIAESVAILRHLHANHWPLYALTNWPAEHFPIALERYDFLRIFAGVVVSGREGMVKPSAQIFDLLCRRYAITPGEAVFIDDSAANIEGAKAFGLQTIHFESPASLREGLLALGVPLPT